MARSNFTRIVVDLNLVLEDPLLIGGEAAAGIDVVPFVDGKGRTVIPGTSLAGVLREALSGSVANDLGMRGDLLFGDAETIGASRLSIHDVVLHDVVLERRDGVGINRQSGAAAAGVKFDRLVVARGAWGRLQMLCDLGAPNGPADPLPELRKLISTLCRSGVRLGSGTTRGQGKIRFSLVSARSFDLSSPGGVLDLAEKMALGESSTTVGDLGEPIDLAADHGSLTGAPTITIDWQPVLPILVSDGLRGDAVDHWPLIVRAVSGDGDLAPRAAAILPASSIKGALRARAEWIIRTIVGPGGPTPSGFQEQLDVPVVNHLFGIVDNRRQSSQRGALIFRDCVADLRHDTNKGPVSWIEWQERGSTKKVEGDPIGAAAGSLKEMGLSNLVPRSHIAIDRWSGAVAGSRLFSEIEPWGLEWTPIVIEIDLRMLPNDEVLRRAAAALLLLLLDEMESGNVTFGSRASRGYGSVEIRSIDRDGLAALCPELRRAAAVRGLRELDVEIRSQLSEALCSLVDQAAKSGSVPE